MYSVRQVEWNALTVPSLLVLRCRASPSNTSTCLPCTSTWATFIYSYLLEHSQRWEERGLFVKPEPRIPFLCKNHMADICAICGPHKPLERTSHLAPPQQSPILYLHMFPFHKIVWGTICSCLLLQIWSSWADGGKSQGRIPSTHELNARGQTERKQRKNPTGVLLPTEPWSSAGTAATVPARRGLDVWKDQTLIFIFH